MTNAVVMFIVGALTGCLSLHLYQRSYWTKQLKLTRQALFDQYSHDLSEVRTQLSGAAEQQAAQAKQQEQELRSHYEKRTETLTAQLSELRTQTSAQKQAQTQAQQQAQQRLKIDYEAQLKSARDIYTQLKTKYHNDQRNARENVDVVLQQNVEVEARNKKLQADIEQLVLEQQQLRETHRLEKAAFENSQKGSAHKSAIDFEQVTQALFPRLKLLRDSIEEIRYNKKETGAILRRLLALENKNFEYSKKVHSTGGYWFECKAPHMKMIRIYFRKENASPSQQCEVLVSRKKDEKSQEKDLAWLRQQARKK